MIPRCPGKRLGYELLVDGVSMKFSYRAPDSSSAPDGMKVSPPTFHTLFESYENSWGTMVTLTTRGIFVAKEASLMTSSHFP